MQTYYACRSLITLVSCVCLQQHASAAVFLQPSIQLPTTVFVFKRCSATAITLDGLNCSSAQASSPQAQQHLLGVQAGRELKFAASSSSNYA